MFRALSLFKLFFVYFICLDVEEMDANVATVPGLSKLLEPQRTLQRFLRGFYKQAVMQSALALALAYLLFPLICLRSRPE